MDREPKDEFTLGERCVGGCCLGYLIGAVGIPIGLLVFFVLFAPDAFNDGQFGMVFIAGPLEFGPVGAVIGSIAGAIIYKKSKTSEHK